MGRAERAFLTFAFILMGVLPGRGGDFCFGADEGYLKPGESFQAKAEKGKILTVKAQTKKGIVCILLNTAKKDFDWDLTNNQKQTIEPFAYATPEKPTFTVKVDRCDHPQGKARYSYRKP